MRITRPGTPAFLKIAMIGVVSFCVVCPLARMMTYVTMEEARAVLGSPRFSECLAHSLVATSVATLLSLGLALLLACCLTRTNMPGKAFFRAALVIPMLIPSISHSMGLILLFGKNGLITRALGLSGAIYGLPGIVCGAVLYSFPFALVMLVDILRYEDYAPYEAAEVLGIPRGSQFLSITVPYLRKPFISVAFATFTTIFTDYGVPLAIGGKYTTLPVLMYQEVVGQLNFGRGSVLGLVLLLPAIVAFIFDATNRDRAGGNTVTMPFRARKGRARDGSAFVACTAVAGLIAAVILAFAFLTFATAYPINITPTLRNVVKAFDLNGGMYLLNSAIMALAVAVIGVGVGFGVAYVTARMRSWLSGVLHLLTITSLAIPGIVLGIAYVLFFKGSFLYGTLGLLILVNLAHFLASPYMMMYNTLGKLNENLEGVGETLGVGRARIVMDVIVPQVRPTLFEMGAYLFVNSMVTISAVSFLSTTANKPFSLMINQFEALMLTECAAVVSLVLLAINMSVKGLIYLLKKHYTEAMA